MLTVSTSEEKTVTALQIATDLLTKLTEIERKSSLDNQNSDFLAALLSRIESVTRNETDRLRAFVTDVEIRQKIYLQGEKSLKNFIEPLSSTLRKLYGQQSGVALQCETIHDCCEHPQDIESLDALSESIVIDSKQSFGTIAQAFSELIEGLFTIQPLYKPGNEELALSQLTTKLAQLNAANSNVCVAYSSLQKYRKIRDELFEDLHICLLRIKSNVRQQFGESSDEYRTVAELV